MATIQETATGRVYFVQYDENQFLKYDKAGQDFCFETWAKKAEPLECDRVVLQLLPDQFFPLHGNDKPYIFREVAVDGGKPAPFVVRTQCTVELDKGYNDLPENERLVIRQDAREAGKRSGCDAWMVIHGATVVEKGRNRA